MISMICVIGFLVASCKKDPIGTSKTPCSGATPEFLSLYSNATQQQQLTDVDFVDTEVHSYSFEVNTPKTVCSIGYQSCAGLSQIPYLIEIRDSVTNAVLFYPVTGKVFIVLLCKNRQKLFLLSRNPLKLF